MNKMKLAGTVMGVTLMGATGGMLLNAVTANADSTTTAATTAAATPTDATTTADTTAATTTTATATPAATPATSSATPAAQPDRSQGGHVGANGTQEVVLTGDTATKAKAAALAAEPGATVVRAETDAEGATYEVHMTKADGSQVTVKLDANFAVTTTEAGM